MPTPVSSTRTRTRRFGSGAQVMVSRPPFGIAWMAFCARLRNTSRSCAASPSTSSPPSVQPRVIDTPARCASGCTASSTLDNERRDRDRAELRFVGPHELQEALDALVEPADFLLDDLDVLRRRLPRRQLLLQQLEMNGHRIQRVLHLVRDAGGQPADHRNAARQLGQLRRLDALRRRRAQLRADLIEDVAELAELLVVAQIERRAEIAAAQARQAAADHVHRPQHELREQHRGARRRSAAR